MTHRKSERRDATADGFASWWWWWYDTCRAASV